MPHGSYSLGETAANQKMMRLVCDKCGRRGQYRIERLLEQYGPDIAMPDLRHELAPAPGGTCNEWTSTTKPPRATTRFDPWHQPAVLKYLDGLPEALAHRFDPYIGASRHR